MMQYNKRKLMSIDCTVYGCGFSGDILEWLVIEYVLKWIKRSKFIQKIIKISEKKFSNIDDRTDVEQLILLLYCDLMIKHSSNPLAHYVDQLSKKNEINILNIHFDKNFSVTKTASHQRDFVEKLYGLMVFCIGPDYEGKFHLKENDQCKLDTGELYYNVE